MSWFWLYHISLVTFGKSNMKDLVSSENVTQTPLGPVFHVEHVFEFCSLPKQLQSGENSRFCYLTHNRLLNRLSMVNSNVCFWTANSGPKAKQSSETCSPWKTAFRSVLVPFSVQILQYLATKSYNKYELERHDLGHSGKNGPLDKTVSQPH